ncbi:2Fe-2S iron-sulfur cluster-binding protein [Planctomicrobium sp. SH664]|uniref:2Fe-2S iron-sulfur cluster-binding protein n=1 Tax=Planctomicrobium sp. SH664 TaxID=3448125 RepID=UPI003F5BEBE5
MPKVTFTNEQRTIEVPRGANLREEALRQGVQLHPWLHSELNCKGHGLCASCRVNVKSGEKNLQRKRWWEAVLEVINPLWMIARIGKEETMVLACQTKVEGDCEVETRPSLNWHGERFWP